MTGQQPTSHQFDQSSQPRHGQFKPLPEQQLSTQPIQPVVQQPPPAGQPLGQTPSVPAQRPPAQPQRQYRSPQQPQDPSPPQSPPIQRPARSQPAQQPSIDVPQPQYQQPTQPSPAPQQSRPAPVQQSPPQAGAQPQAPVQTQPNQQAIQQPQPLHQQHRFPRQIPGTRAQIKKVEDGDDYVHVRIRDPDAFDTIRTPDWAAEAAGSVHEGSEVRTGKLKGSDGWSIESVLVTKPIDTESAIQVASQIVQKIES
ncbi:MAG: hypothetical protein ABEI77_09695 [Halorientalis sp.]